MNQKSFLQIFAFVAFAALMGVSCWATVESLHLLLPSWPVVLFWAVTVIFFVVASLGTKLIVDSFNQRIRIDNRGWRLAGGIILLLAFWLCFSLPTNTHTFFYRSEITPVLLDEVQKTKDNLEFLQKGGKAKELIESEKQKFLAETNALFKNFMVEVRNHERPGIGPEADKVLLSLKEKLGTIQVPTLKDKHNLAAVRTFEAQMETQIRALQDIKIKEIYDKRLKDIDDRLKQQDITKYIGILAKIKEHIEAHPSSHDEPSQATVDVLVNCFSIINGFSDYLVEKTDDAKKLQAEFKLPKTRRMLSVIDVWKEYLSTDNFDGRGFAFWIIIAALVDIAGFIFFDIAFAKRDNFN